MGVYSVLINYQSLLSNFLPLAPQIISFFMKYGRNRLHLESFIELPVEDFMIFQLVNKRTSNSSFSLVTSHIAHLFN